MRRTGAAQQAYRVLAVPALLAPGALCRSGAARGRRGPPLAAVRGGFAGLRPAVLGGPWLSRPLAPLPPACVALAMFPVVLPAVGRCAAALRKTVRRGTLVREVEHVNEQMADALRDALMTMTETEAAALDFLARLDDAREAMRRVIERGERG